MLHQLVYSSGLQGCWKVILEMQAIVVMESGKNVSAGLIWDIGEVLMVGESWT
jgi:hypothetical protein